MGVTSAGLSRNEETEGDRRLQGMRSKEGKQRRNKGKTSEKCLIPETASSFPEERKCRRPQNQLQWQEREGTAHGKERKMTVKHFAKIKSYKKIKKIKSYIKSQ